MKNWAAPILIGTIFSVIFSWFLTQDAWLALVSMVLTPMVAYMLHYISR